MQRSTTRVLLSSVAALAVACGGERGTTGPRLPGNPPPNPAIQSAAFIADVNLRTGRIKISEPLSAFAPSGSVVPGGEGRFGKPGTGDGPYGSIITGDVIELTASNYVASTVGQFTPNKIRVSFDINISNRLASVELITPTFPTPPAGVSGVLLFPYSAVATVTTGGVSVGGDGTEVIVEQPSYGAVDASIAWEGAPHNFFNDAGCGAGSSDCFRYEAFAEPLAAGSTSEARSVGFDIDPTVGSFRARLIVAADLRNSGAAPTGTIAGSVSSPQRGALAGVLVSVSGGFSGSTDGSGAYSVSGVNTGPRTVSLSNLPAQCTAPAPQSTTVTNGATATVNFVVQCEVPAGSIGGTISSSQGGGLAGVSVTATPTGGSAVAPAISSGSGTYSIPSVPVGGAGTGSLALGNLPTNCVNPGPLGYSGLTDGGSITVDVTVSCSAPPQGYQYSATWGSISGGTVQLTLRIDMSTFNDPAVNGTNPDDIDRIQGTLNYDPARLQFASAANLPGSGLQNFTANGATAGVVQWLNFTTNPGVATQQGLQGLLVITFNVLAGAPAAVTTSNSFIEVLSRDEVDLIPRIIVTEGTLSIP